MLTQSDGRSLRQRARIAKLSVWPSEEQRPLAAGSGVRNERLTVLAP